MTSIAGLFLLLKKQQVFFFIYPLKMFQGNSLCGSHENL